MADFHEAPKIAFDNPRVLQLFIEDELAEEALAAGFVSDIDRERSVGLVGIAAAAAVKSRGICQNPRPCYLRTETFEGNQVTVYCKGESTNDNCRIPIDRCATAIVEVKNLVIGNYEELRENIDGKSPEEVAVEVRRSEDATRLRANQILGNPLGINR